MSKLPVGIQVFGLRKHLQDTPEKFVMQEIKNMGYDGVELAGLYGLEPTFVRDILKKVGLIPISAHIPLAEMVMDMDKVISDYTTVGVSYVVVPYLPAELRPLTDGYEKALEDIRTIGEKANIAGLKLLYHNHDFEFVKLPSGEFGFDNIYSTISEDLLMVEPDTCWIKVAGQDPVEYIRKYGSRCEIIHLKDFIKEGNPANLYQLIGINVKQEEDKPGFFQFRPV